MCNTWIFFLLWFKVNGIKIVAWAFIFRFKCLIYRLWSTKTISNKNSLQTKEFLCNILKSQIYVPWQCILMYTGLLFLASCTYHVCYFYLLQSFEALNQRAVAVVVDPIQSVKGKVVIDAFRLINPQTMMLGQEPRQTTSNLGHLNKPSIQVSVLKFYSKVYLLLWFICLLTLLNLASYSPYRLLSMAWTDIITQ